MIATIDHKAGDVSAKATMMRIIAFRVGTIACVTALVMIPLYEHWYSSFPPYGALASQSLHYWLNVGWISAVTAIFGSLFGKGPQRIIVLFLAVLELYFWLVLSIAG